MKRVLLLILILFSCGTLCTANPVPVNAIEGADTSYEIDHNNELKEKQIIPVNNENVIDEMDANPINFDASADNVKDENFKPADRVIEEDVVQGVEEKTKRTLFGRQKNKLDKDIKEVNNEEKTDVKEDIINENSPLDSSGIIEDVVSEPEQTVPKTYTQEDYEQMYRDMQVPTFTFVHGVDPDQYYDMKDTTWSPYPLFRLNAPLYFKTIVIEPGYYLLTPRKYKDDWYLLFKEAGKVKYTIPVFAKDYTPENYYRDNLPELEMDKSQRWQIKFLNAWGKYVRSSKRKPSVKTNVELTDLDNNFLLIEIYYGATKYSTIFRTEKF